MEADDSCVLVGSRKSLPQVFIATEAEVGTSNLRHRYSSGSSSVGSSGTPNCITPPISTSTPHSKAAMPKFGTPGCISTGYGSFQPSSYTDAYVPPLSLDNENFRSYQNQFPNQKKVDEAIRIDSGYGRYSDSSSSFNMPVSNQSFSSNSTSLWDTIVASPVQNLRQKLRGRPSYVDESSSSRGWKVKPQQVLACLIFALIVTSIGFALFISYKHFNKNENDGNKNRKARVIDSEMEDTAEKDGAEVITEVHMVKSDKIYLLKDDITVKEVENMKIKMEFKLNSSAPSPQVILDNDKSLSKDEANVLSKLAGSVEVILANGVLKDEINVKGEIKTEVELNGKEVENVQRKKRRTKNANPLMKSIPEVKQSKVKSESMQQINVEVGMEENSKLENPDDPMFRGVQPMERVKRERTEDEVVFGDKFRKYKDEGMGGFRKKEVLDARDE